MKITKTNMATKKTNPNTSPINTIIRIGLKDPTNSGQYKSKGNNGGNNTKLPMIAHLNKRLLDSLLDRSNDV
jgi:hypothetical protein